MSKTRNVKLTEVKWDDGRVDAEIVLEIPGDTPSWGLLQAVRKALLSRFGETPYAYTI